MTISAAVYNLAQLEAKKLTGEHVVELVRYWQRGHGLTPDGMAGPRTITSLAPVGALTVVDGWFVGPGVTTVAAHPSWYGGLLSGAEPGGIVWHYTATDPGTASNMAKRRASRYTGPAADVTSWHLTIEVDGGIWQQVPLDHVAHHAGGKSARPVPGLGHANYTCVGIELVGWGKTFPAAQVAAARTVARALVAAYGIKREHAGITHHELDPTRRSDPGPVWDSQHAPGVLAYAYA